MNERDALGAGCASVGDFLELDIFEFAKCSEDWLKYLERYKNANTIGSAGARSGASASALLVNLVVRVLFE